MPGFNSEVYIPTLKDILHDLSIDDLSYRGKIILTRSFAEIIVRRLLDIKENQYFELGSKDTKESLEKAGYTEPFFVDSLNIIRITSNKTYHTQKPKEISEVDWDKVYHALEKLYAYLFYKFFQKYKFGSDNIIVSKFSLLPPIIRALTLEYLYSDNNQNDILIIDKLLLAKIKAYGFEQAQEWLNSEKEHFQRISYQCFPLVQEENTLFEQLQEKIILFKNYKPIYTNFAQAKDYYQEYGVIQAKTDDETEFNSLMEFVYLGQ